jgi:hypothetical protein
MLLSLFLFVAAGGKKQHAGHHAPSSGPHAGDKKSKNQKGTGATKKGIGYASVGRNVLVKSNSKNRGIPTGTA